MKKYVPLEFAHMTQVPGYEIKGEVEVEPFLK